MEVLYAIVEAVEDGQGGQGYDVDGRTGPHNFAAYSGSPF